ncbi:hypothetical protein THAOC_33966 [Thalassiosira oceanica]|uniref:Uncharacterized protein n=1 Tax=Thalassiosira oceanica TaxID=159749 RepID=K0RKY0_THAOC|nr:hypothetical protein THAOC_33966 [Thalassiosira oceanica]|mmetsp:Transcript_414/g.897  ORF Transcript_414/g.897 Transcript_414/m.897 type:complete len:112 (+) Transcript_414:280-615(+)|eukprot:EJK47322.1 hypothetical protein THAOC_33966 [Thalassiosira oceanica]
MTDPPPLSPHQHRNASNSSVATTDNEYVKLKLALVQTRARTDSARLQARQMISKRNALKEETVKIKSECEEQVLILEQTQESNARLREQIEKAEESRRRLLEQTAKENVFT